MRPRLLVVLAMVLLPDLSLAGEIRSHLDTEGMPSYLRDRGEGIPISMFGTYVQKGQVIVYPFFEYYRNHGYEYVPADFGGTDENDYFGDYEATEYLLFVAYGISDRLAIELEGAVTSAELERNPGDASALPVELQQGGLGDVEGQLRFRWARETSGRPEIFSYFETVAPTQKSGSVIGTSDWEWKLGSGLVRGFSFGTLTIRGAIEYDNADQAFGMGEMAFEYLRRLSSRWRVFAGIEGAQDEWEVITEAQWHLSPGTFLKFNSGFGATKKANDWAPELGVVFSL